MRDMQLTQQSEGEEMPSLYHSYVCAQMMRQLLQDERLQSLPELTLDIENGLTPDISVFPKEHIHVDSFEDTLKVQQAPLLAIEIISSSQTIQAMLAKAKVLLNAGVKVVWTVEPYGRSIFVSTGQGEQLFHEEPVESEGIHVDFSQVFIH